MKIIFEHGKERKIYVPTIIEQWLHHIIVAVLEPIIIKTAHPNVCGSFPGRGPHYGKRKIEKWRKDWNCKVYFAKTDIRHFYDSINYSVLFRELSLRIKDEWFLYIIDLCLSTFKKGLPLGFYLSQWLANYILEPIDWMVDEKFSKYVRYMDDMVIFGTDINDLKDAVNNISATLETRFNLKLKGNYQVSKFENGRGSGRAVNFMGFIFYRDHTTMRKSIMTRATRLSRRIFMRRYDDRKPCRRQIHAVLSYMGWFTHTDSYNCYRRWIKPYVDIGRLKKTISSMDRRNKSDRMDHNKVLRRT